MNLVKPAKVRGVVTAPASKSVLQRAIFAAALARGTSRIRAASWCDDSVCALGAVSALGAATVRREGEALITGNAVTPARQANCGESGLCLRMMAALAARMTHEITLTGEGTLLQRPVGMIANSLRELGVACHDSAGCLPFVVCGPLRYGKVRVDGSMTSQFASGLVMALPLCAGPSELEIAELQSGPYLGLTLQVMRDFGVVCEASADLSLITIPGSQSYQTRNFEVEGDWSGASCLLVAGALAGQISIGGLRPDSLQPDRRLLTVLEQSGALVEWEGQTVTVRYGSLRPFEFDATDCPDLFPALVALACGCPGTSVVHGAQRLRHKESDRLQVLMQEFARVGGQLKTDGRRLEVQGGRLQGGEIDAHHDHRIAMSAAVAALVSERGIAIQGAECVNKSYPGFFQDLTRLMEST